MAKAAAKKAKQAVSADSKDENATVEDGSTVETVVRTVTRTPAEPAVRKVHRGGMREKPLTGRPISILYRLGTGKAARWVLVGRVDSGPVPDDDTLRATIPILRERGGRVKMTCPLGGQSWREVAAEAVPGMIAGETAEPEVRALEPVALEPERPPWAQQQPPWSQGMPPWMWQQPPWMQQQQPAAQPASVDWIAAVGAFSPILIKVLDVMSAGRGGGSNVSEMVEAVGKLRKMTEDGAKPEADDGLLGQLAQLAPLLSLARGPVQPQLLPPPPPVQPAPVVVAPPGVNGTPSQVAPSPAPAQAEPSEAERLGAALSESGFNLGELAQYLEGVPPAARARVVAGLVGAFEAQADAEPEAEGFGGDDGAVVQ